MVSYIEPSWPNKVYDERERGMVSNEMLNVTIFIWYEGMRIHLPFLPYEAAYEEVVRRCELALGGMRLPPTVWFTCRACHRRLSLSNDPQRRMPGSCRPDRPWEWTMHIPFRVYMTMDPNPMKDSNPMRMPSKYEMIQDVCLVALKALDQPHMMCRIILKGKDLPYESTVEECGIKEDDRLVLELIPPLKVTVVDEFNNEDTYEFNMCSHSRLRTLVRHVTDSEDIQYVQRGLRIVWQAGDSLDKTLWDLGVRFECSIKVYIGGSKNASTSHGVQTREKKSFSCQTDE